MEHALTAHAVHLGGVGEPIPTPAGTRPCRAVLPPPRWLTEAEVRDTPAPGYCDLCVKTVAQSLRGAARDQRDLSDFAWVAPDGRIYFEHPDSLWDLLEGLEGSGLNSSVDAELEAEELQKAVLVEAEKDRAVAHRLDLWRARLEQQRSESIDKAFAPQSNEIVEVPQSVRTVSGGLPTLGRRHR